MSVPAAQKSQSDITEATLGRLHELRTVRPFTEALQELGFTPETFFSNLALVRDDIDLRNRLEEFFFENDPVEFKRVVVGALRNTHDESLHALASAQLRHWMRQGRNTDDEEIFHALVGSLAAPTPSIYHSAIRLLSGLDVLKYPGVLRDLAILMAQDNKTAKCNVFDVIINITCKTPAYLEPCAREIVAMVEDLSATDDILYHMNILELLTTLAVTPHGYAFCIHHKIFDRLDESTKCVMTHPMGRLVLPGYMKLFGAVAHLHPAEMLRSYPAIVECMFEGLKTADTSLLPVSLDTLGFVGRTVEGKLALAELGGKLQAGVTNVCELICDSPTEFKLRALNCMEGLISVEANSDPSDPAPSHTDPAPNPTDSAPIDLRVTLMTREWFRSLKPQGNPMDVLYQICKGRVFSEIMMAAVGLLDAVCQYKWGCEMVALTPGFIEFLLDRSCPAKSKVMIFRVVTRLSRSSAFNATLTDQIMAFIAEGIYGVRDLQVAMEEGD